jgi:hypothetical protein
LAIFPARSESISFDGTLLDYLPVQVICKGATCSGTLNSGYDFVGNIDPAGNQHGNMDYTAHFDQLIATRMLDTTSAPAQGSTLIEEDYWELQFSVTLPANTPFETDQTVTSGITATDQTIFSYTIGANPSGIGASLTRSFQHTVEVASQQSTTYKFQWPARAAETTVGVYQLKQSFSVRAGSNLTTYISQANKILGECIGVSTPGALCLRLESDAVFPYPTSTFLQAATTPPPPTVSLGLHAVANIGKLFTAR